LKQGTVSSVRFGVIYSSDFLYSGY